MWLEVRKPSQKHIVILLILLFRVLLLFVVYCFDAKLNDRQGRRRKVQRIIGYDSVVKIYTKNKNAVNRQYIVGTGKRAQTHKLRRCRIKQS